MSEISEVSKGLRILTLYEVECLIEDDTGEETKVLSKIALQGDNAYGVADAVSRYHKLDAEVTISGESRRIARLVRVESIKRKGDVYVEELL